MREMGKGVGRPVPRSEDARLVTGQGRYTDDIEIARPAAMFVLRSPHGCARILSIDVDAARDAPGVIGVYTGADLRQAGLQPMPSLVARKAPDGSPNPVPPYHALAFDQVRHIGEAVAIVVAERLLDARDASELITIDYQPLPSITDTAAAMRADAPAVWPEAPDNRCFFFELGDRAASESAFAAAAHVARELYDISRVTTSSMEPRTAMARFDPGDGRYTLTSGVQNPHTIRNEIARIFSLPASQLRVVSPDVGGAFGMKGSLYPEQILVLWAARLTGRTVKWISDRSEAFLSDHQSRDNLSDVSLALDADGRFLALRVETTADLGAYLALNGTHVPTNNLGGLAGVYRTPCFDVRVTGVFTHRPPTCPFRGAGRPEASYCVERIIDKAAHALGIDPAELRRRNMIAPHEMPYRTGLVYTYDCGEFEAILDRCLAASDRDGFAHRRRLSEAAGKMRGIGMACVIEIAGGPQGRPLEEAVDLRFDADGTLSILAGTHSQGQGHETIYRQLAHETFGLPFENVRVVAGDTDAVFHGVGTFGSRTTLAGGHAFLTASRKVIDKAKRVAGHLLEAADADLELVDGSFVVAGTDRSITFHEVARASFNRQVLPRDEEIGLFGNASVAPGDASFPNGCHICEVEIDPSTGTVAVVRYTVVDDVGTVLNPLLLEGQIHGGVAQGIGQALMETIVYDASDGQLLTGSFQDYCLPRAENVPAMAVLEHAVPTATNLLGAKGAGEAGTVGALPAVMNAVADALRRKGVTRIDMPASPQAIWRALRQKASSYELNSPIGSSFSH